ncbi:MAG: glutamate--tRNA ligase [Candidatus Micrarchaeota archaeon]|nr:glutamate--tRNA ligase [Candidatus Micrarchaeota archaeon]
MLTLSEVIRKHVLKNAFDYGKATPGGVVGKVIAECPEAKVDMKATMAGIDKIVEEINSLSKQEIENELKNYSFVEKKIEEKKIVFPNVENGSVVVRFPPEPNGYPHIGHAKAFFLEWTVARENNGKVILRWDDTNPEAEKKEFLDAIRDGIKWLGMDWDEEVYCSDYMPKLYSLNEQLFKQGDAYVCQCSQEKTAEGREKMQRCKCADATVSQQVMLWKKMLDGSIVKGGATVRLKADMASLNTVMRDPTLWRIIEASHYKQGNKYRVWPTYDFQGSVMDSLLGITHPLRSKEYELRDELYFYLLRKLKLREPTLVTISRLSLQNSPISKRLLKPLVESGKLMGWDDPRLPTLAGLRRRGIQPQAIKNFVLSFGLSKVESNPSWERLLVENKKLLEPQAEHFFFVPDGVKLKITGKAEVENRDKAANHNVAGVQDMRSVYVPKTEIVNGGEMRLKGFASVKIKGKAGNVIEKIPEKKVQWVFVENAVKTKLLIPGELLNENGDFNEDSLKELSGFCPPSVLELKEGDVVQFERVGFARLDKKTKSTATFIFSC